MVLFQTQVGCGLAYRRQHMHYTTVQQIKGIKHSFFSGDYQCSIFKVRLTMENTLPPTALSDFKFFLRRFLKNASLHPTFFL